MDLSILSIFSTHMQENWSQANQSVLSPQQELVEDLMAVIHSFSCRLYGLRKYRKKITKMIAEQEPSNIC